MRQFYACAYGHVVRFSEKVATPQEAAMECFGVVNRVTVLEAGTSKVQLRKHSYRKSLVEKLTVLHKEKTGNDISSY